MRKAKPLGARSGMKPDVITEQILALVETFFNGAVIAGLMSDLKGSDALERSMLGQKGNAKTDPGRVPSLRDQDKLDRLITVCYSRLSVDDVCRVLMGIGDIFKVHGETRRAEELYTAALTLGEKSEKKGHVADAYLRRGEIYSWTGQWKQSSSDLGRSRAIFTELRQHESLGRVENILGTNCAEQGKTRQAVEFFGRALALFERTEQPQLAGVALMNLGIVCNIMGDIDSALTHYKRAQSCFEGVGDLHRLAELHHNIGMSYLSKQLFAESINEFNTSYALSSRIHLVSVMGLASLGRSNAYFHQNDPAMALQLVTRAIELFNGSSDRLSLADAYKMKGMIHRKMKRFDSAKSYLQTSLRINTELNNRLNIAESYFEIGQLELDRKLIQLAMAAFQKARTGFRKVGAKEQEKKTLSIMNSIRGKQ